MLTYEVRTSQLAPQLTAVVRGEMTEAQLPLWLPEAYAAVFSYLATAGVPAIAPPFARYTFQGDTVEVEAGAAVSEAVAGEGRVQPSSLPGGPAAMTTHIGSYEQLDKAVEAVTRWLGSRNLQPAGSHWEVYLTDPNAEPDPERWRTEVVVPYQPESDAAPS